MAFCLSSTADIEKVCRLAARIVCPERDLSALKFPNKEQVRQILVKLDLMHSFSRRVFMKPSDSECRVRRYLSSDSSPQGHWDFFCTTEELLVRTVPIQTFCSSQDFSPLVGFHWIKRSLPLMTIGRGESSTAKKVACLSHAIILENGMHNLAKYRDEVKIFLSDQGTVPAGPNYIKV